MDNIEIRGFEKAVSRLENRKLRSCWDRGVRKYALEIAKNVRWFIEVDGQVPLSSLEKAALSGAKDWESYSYAGCSLIRDKDIALRLATPWQFKHRFDEGRKHPNRKETWIDVQGRALHQAFLMLRDSIYDALEG